MLKDKFGLGNITNQSCKNSVYKTVDNYQTMLEILKKVCVLFLQNQKVELMQYIRTTVM